MLKSMINAEKHWQMLRSIGYVDKHWLKLKIALIKCYQNKEWTAPASLVIFIGMQTCWSTFISGTFFSNVWKSKLEMVRGAFSSTTAFWSSFGIVPHDHPLGASGQLTSQGGWIDFWKKRKITDFNLVRETFQRFSVILDHAASVEAKQLAWTKDPCPLTMNGRFHVEVDWVIFGNQQSWACCSATDLVSPQLHSSVKH